MMYDKRTNRYVTDDGYSLVSEYEKARSILIHKDDDPSLVIQSDKTDFYDSKYQEVTSVGIDVVHDCITPPEHQHTAQEFDSLVDRLFSSDRLESTSKELSRLEEELDFFDRENHILFVLRVSDLIKQFKNDGVVWGVGRGSSCASFVLYLLDVHDINPIKYDIPFSEMSKEVC